VIFSYRGTKKIENEYVDTGTRLAWIRSTE